MGFAIGGIAAPIPTAIAGNASSGATLTATPTAMLATDGLMLHFVAHLTNGVPQHQINIRVVDGGGNHDFTSANLGTAEGWINGGFFYCKDGVQSLYVNTAGMASWATAIDMTSVSSIILSYASGAGTFDGMSVLRLR